MKENGLFDSDEPLTLQRLQEYFQAHDFSTQTSGYKPQKATDEQNQMYLRAKRIFLTFWEQQMKNLCNKGSLKNYSSDSPIRCLEESEENLVAGTVMELLAREEHCIVLVDHILTRMQEPINAEAEKYAQANSKTLQELTEEDYQQILDAFADEFLFRMMKLLLQVQNVPEIFQFSSRNGAHEDFDRNILKNYDKIDFLRRWYHMRTEVGAPLSLTPEIKENTPSSSGQPAVESIELGLIFADTNEEIAQNLLNAFVDLLDNDVDRQIVYMRADGKTQAEIAKELGYASHSPVVKRLQRLKQQFLMFMAQIKGA